jgi:hypothetical protein
LLERIDEEITKIRRRRAIDTVDVKEMLGSLGAEYSWHCDRVSHTRTEVTNMLLDLRSTHMETPEEVNDDRESISKELDALVGSDINDG